MIIGMIKAHPTEKSDGKASNLSQLVWSAAVPPAQASR
jgi:hypothetical protein